MNTLPLKDYALKRLKVRPFYSKNSYPDDPIRLLINTAFQFFPIFISLHIIKQFISKGVQKLLL